MLTSIASAAFPVVPSTFVAVDSLLLFDSFLNYLRVLRSSVKKLVRYDVACKIICLGFLKLNYLVNLYVSSGELLVLC